MSDEQFDCSQCGDHTDTLHEGSVSNVAPVIKRRWTITTTSMTAGRD